MPKLPKLEEFKSEMKNQATSQIYEDPNWAFKGRSGIESLDDIVDILSNYGYHTISSVIDDF